MMTSVIEDKITHFQEATERSVDTFIDGSNEHLDNILRITNPLNKITGEFAELNDMLIKSLDGISNDKLRNEILPKLKATNKSCAGLIGAIRSCYLYRDVRIALNNFCRQYDAYREIMYDVQNIRLADDAELDHLLGGFNRQ